MDTDNVKISVILPCYNVSPYIDRCIQSILQQTFLDYEIICVNDGSTDNTLEELNKWKEHPKFRILSFQNQGVSQARNEGLFVAKGEFVYFLDPDDYIDRSTLEIAYNTCIQNNSDAVQFAYQSIEENTGKKSWVRLGNKSKSQYEGIEIVTELLPRFIGYSRKDIANYGTPIFSEEKEMASVWRFLYKRKILIDNNIFFPKGVRLAEDRIFNCKFFCYAHKISIINDVLYNYIIKDSGAMYFSLASSSMLYKDKINLAQERNRLKILYKDVHKIDILDTYIGSLIFSAFELYAKLVKAHYKQGFKGLQEYLSLEEVKIAFKTTDSKNLPIKVKIPLLFTKYGMSSFLYTSLWLLNRLKRG